MTEFRRILLADKPRFGRQERQWQMELARDNALPLLISQTFDSYREIRPCTDTELVDGSLSVRFCIDVLRQIQI